MKASETDQLIKHRYEGEKLPYGRYLVVRKDGKTHIETFNGTSWAYNHNSIKHYFYPKID